MGVLSTIALIIFFCFVLMDKADGDSMTLSSSSATVGQLVTLQCAYVGSSTPFIINFYLDPDILGLKVRITTCNILSWTGYDISLYEMSCGTSVKEVNLTIKSVTAADIGTTWYCDASFITGPASIAKASTIITAPSTGGNYMTLSSSPATVGQPLTLRCAYMGSYNPSIINFYFDRKSNGLQIFISSCTYLSTTGYNTTLYDKTCGVKEVNLTIKSVTQADIGTTWECDASFFGGPSTFLNKNSTIIQAKSSSVLLG